LREAVIVIMLRFHVPRERNSYEDKQLVAGRLDAVQNPRKTKSITKAEALNPEERDR